MAGNTENDGLDDIENKLNDTNYDAMEWDQKESPPPIVEFDQRKSQENKDSEKLA